MLKCSLVKLSDRKTFSCEALLYTNILPNITAVRLLDLSKLEGVKLSGYFIKSLQGLCTFAGGIELKS